MPLIGLVILMLEIEFAMAGRWTCRGSNSAAAPLAGPPALDTQRFSGAFRSRRRQLTQIPIKPPALAWGRRSASGRRCRPITSRPPSLSQPPALRSHRPLRTLRTRTTPRPPERTRRTYSTHARHRCTHCRYASHNLSRTNGVHPAFALDHRTRPTRNSCTRKKDGYELMAESLNAVPFALGTCALIRQR